MIRFSAALVAVAIGVLIGGIATSKLVLVYLAIVVSAVSLLALAVGVVVKRGELFGSEQGLVPAGAGASPVLPVAAGESRSRSRRSRKAASVTPRPAETAAAAVTSAALAGTVPGAPSAESAPSPAAELAPSSAVPVLADPDVSSPGDAVPSGEEPAVRNEWSSSSPARTSWAPAGTDLDAPQAAGPSVTAGLTAEPVSLSWFDRLGESAAAGTEAGGTVAGAGSGGAWGWTAPPRDATPPADTPQPPAPAQPDDEAQPGDKADPDAAAVSGDDDDDWPTRYSWLDDEADTADESVPATAPAPVAVSDTAESADTAAALAQAVPELTIPADEPDEAAGEPEPGTSAAGSGLDDAGSGSEPDPAAETEPGSEPSAELESEPPAEPETESSAEPETEAADAGDAAGRTAPAAETGLVSVVRGVPRYHDPDCVLIRFMPETEVQRMAVPEAAAAGCTPCTVCESQV